MYIPAKSLAIKYSALLAKQAAVYSQWVNHMTESGWIEFLKKQVKKDKNVLVGIGDDCAVVRLGREKFLLKSDLFIEGVHFKIGKTGFKDIGRRAIARVLSDFAAMAAKPKFIGVSLGKPAYVNTAALKMILAGILELGKKYNFSLVGGDTASSKKLFMDVWGVGTADKYVLRSGAKHGDYIFITGKLGERKFAQAFAPRIEEASYLAANFKINAMIDITDGFVLDLYRILQESKKGALLFKKSIPTTYGEADFYRGEDYELIFTVDRRERKLRELKKKFYCVGRIEDKSFGYKIDTGKKIEDLQVKGYTHF
jgi:thiamine-monophosphate kinase